MRRCISRGVRYPDPRSRCGRNKVATGVRRATAKTRAEGALMQTCRLRAARGRGTAAYPLHPRSLRRRGLHMPRQTRRPRVPLPRLSGREQRVRRASRRAVAAAACCAHGRSAFATPGVSAVSPAHSRPAFAAPRMSAASCAHGCPASVSSLAIRATASASVLLPPGARVLHSHDRMQYLPVMRDAARR